MISEEKWYIDMPDEWEEADEEFDEEIDWDDASEDDGSERYKDNEE